MMNTKLSVTLVLVTLLSASLAGCIENEDESKKYLSAVFGSLTRMMNKIWNTEDKRTFYNRKGTDMFFTILIGLVLSTNIFINTIYSQIGQFFGLVGAGSEEVNWIENIWNFVTVHILPPLLSIGVFTFIYNVIPQRKVIFRRTLPPAIIAPA